MTESKFPKKDFGEIRLKGGLNNMEQVLKTKYLYPTREFPTGKAVIEIIIPESINSISIGKNLLKEIIEINPVLASMTFKREEDQDKAIVARQIEFNSKLINIAQNTKNKPFAVKSFRFEDKDYLISQNMISMMARLFGYQFFKFISNIQSNDEHLSKSRNVVANTIAEKVYNNFIEGFMDGIKEKQEMALVARRSS